MSNIVLIPADNRPVSYTLPFQAAAINKNTKIFIPPRELLGGLHTQAQTDKILNWLEKTLADNQIDYIICALDTIAYGGLVSSRRTSDPLEVITPRIERFKKIVQDKKPEILAFSSIMRISDSNINEEEKPYWDKYGKLIFQYSCKTHKGETFHHNIPAEILEDYLNTRQRNFSVNKIYLEWQEEGVLDFLVFAKDDNAPYGLNIAEANKLGQAALVHTGMDEVILLLLARVVADKTAVFPVYSTLEGANIIPRYEDKPLYQSVKSHLELCGAGLAVSPEQADVILLLHTPQKYQSDLALSIFVEGEDLKAVDFCVNTIKNTTKPVILADVKNANGSDSLLVEKILPYASKLYGYAGWNTASNTIGTALATGLIRYTAEKQSCFSVEDFNRLMFVRFADDWAYQAVVRQRPGGLAAMDCLTKEIARIFGINPGLVNLNLPWCRNFEIEINF